MADSKKDFVHDPEMIEKEQNELLVMLYKNLKLDPSTGYIQKGKDLEGKPRVIFKHPGANLTGNILNDAGWRYGSYYLEGNGQKTGFYKMCENGQWLFIEAENQYNKSEFMKIQTPYEMTLALVSANPSLADKVQVSADNTVQIIGAINDIELPYTSMYYDAASGTIKDSTNPDYAFRIEFTNAMNADLNAINNDNISENKSSPLREANAAMQDFREAEASRDDNAADNVDIDFNPNDVSMEEMQKASQEYHVDGNGEVKVAPSEVGGPNVATSHSFGNVNNTTYTPTKSDERAATLNAVWVQACCQALGIDNTENDAQFLEGEYGNILNIIRIELRNGNESMASIVTSVAQAENIANPAMAAKIAYLYLHELYEKGSITINIDMNAEQLNTISNNAEQTRDVENEPDMVMEMKYPGSNVGSNY